jgi:hypothetical protein
MVKFYPPESFGYLIYCRQRGLPTEVPVAMGIDQNDRGDILIVDRIDGLDYQDIVLTERKNLFGRIIPPKKEIASLGQCVYRFCRQGIAAGDSRLKNYMYDGSSAIRIDLIPQYDSILGIDWDGLNQDPQKAREKIEELTSLCCDIESLMHSMAATLTHRAQSGRRFAQSVDFFLKGYVHDTLSRSFAQSLMRSSGMMVRCMRTAERESETFDDVFLRERLMETPDSQRFEVRLYEH